MRTVLTGAPGALYLLQLSDLPLDLNLRHSFWRWVNFSGFDLSAYDMRDMDILDSNGNTARLGVGKTAMLMSRRTTWTNAVLPLDASSYNHDFVVEVYNKALAGSLSGPVRTSVTLMRNYVAGGYARSWQDAIQQLVNAGLTVPQMRTRFTPIFTAYPKILGRMNQHLDRRLWSPTAPNWTRTRDEEGNDFTPQISGNDRWALARMLEQHILTTRSREVRCYFLQLDPVPVLRVTPREDGLFNDPLWWRVFAD